jgi:ABC-2 type transport system permease protein
LPKRALLVERKVDGVLLLPDQSLEDAARAGQRHRLVDQWYISRPHQGVGEAIQRAIVNTLNDETRGRLGVRIDFADPVVSQPLFNPDLAYGAYIFPAVTPVILQQTMLFGAAVLFAGRRRRGWSELGGQWLALALVSLVLTLTYFGWFFAAQDIPRHAGIGALLVVALFAAGAIAAFALFVARLFPNAASLCCC